MRQPTNEQHDRTVREVMTVRGLAASIQAMAAPTWRNVKDLLAKLGWILNRNPNKQTNNEYDES